MSKMFPLFIDLSGRRVTVYGGGAVAARRTAALACFGPVITVIAPEIRPEIRAVAGVQCTQGRFCAQTLPPSDLVLAATGDAQVNHAIVQECRRRGIPVNNASDRTECDFYFPALAVAGELVVGVNAGGADHALAKRTAEDIRRLLEDRK